jgi:hypothetical protein
MSVTSDMQETIGHTVDDWACAFAEVLLATRDQELSSDARAVVAGLLVLSTRMDTLVFDLAVPVKREGGE